MAPGVGPPRATLEQKIMALDWHHQNQRSQIDTVQHFRGIFAISSSTISDWIKGEEALRERYQEALEMDPRETQNAKQAKRKITFKYERINQAMLEVANDRIEHGLPLTERVLQEYWKKFAQEYGVTDKKRQMSFSHGWLATFKKRHGLNRSESKRITTERSQQPQQSDDKPVPVSSIDDINALPNATGNYGYNYMSVMNAPSLGQERSHHGELPHITTIASGSGSQMTPPSHAQGLREDDDVSLGHSSNPTIQPVLNQHQVQSIGRPQQQDPVQPVLARQARSLQSQISQQQMVPQQHEPTHSAEYPQLTAQLQNYMPLDVRYAYTAEAEKPVDKVDIQDMEKFLFVYGDHFFQQFGPQFAQSRQLFELLKGKFMEEKFGQAGAGKVDELFKRR